MNAPAKILPFARSEEMLQRDATVYLNRLNRMITWALHERNQVEQHPTEPCKRKGWVQVEMAKAMADVCEGDPAEWAENLAHELARDENWAGRVGA